ncbi:hypothetical protein [Pseudogemmobacter bohemicus]|uniref:hypothetical protein n=1 Tax=Pseudogemmobacter bohemicus TaxID=2250708 RepID=UPI000DD398AA|nr:hypothetical protein [Pseudogemmobacter bohemicus]
MEHSGQTCKGAFGRERCDRLALVLPQTEANMPVIRGGALHAPGCVNWRAEDIAMHYRLVFSLITAVAALIVFHPLSFIQFANPGPTPLMPPPVPPVARFFPALWPYAAITLSAGLTGAALAPLWCSGFWGRLVASLITPGLVLGPAALVLELLSRAPDLGLVLLAFVCPPVLIVAAAAEIPSGLMAWSGGVLAAWISGRTIATRRARAARLAAGLNF